MERIEECISFLSGKAAQTVFRQAREALAPFGITPVQYAVLHVLWEKDRITGAEIGARLVLDSATITGVIDRLEKLELIERRADPDDRRMNRLWLTRKGRAKQPKLQREMDLLNGRIKSYFGSEAPRVWKMLQELAASPSS